MLEKKNFSLFTSDIYIYHINQVKIMEIQISLKIPESKSEENPDFIKTFSYPQKDLVKVTAFKYVTA